MDSDSPERSPWASPQKIIYPEDTSNDENDIELNGKDESEAEICDIGGSNEMATENLDQSEEETIEEQKGDNDEDVEESCEEDDGEDENEDVNGQAENGEDANANTMLSEDAAEPKPGSVEDLVEDSLDVTSKAFEKHIDSALQAKAEALEAYKEKDLEKARMKYLSALETLQLVQGDLSNKTKAILFEQTVINNNNVALCCLGLEDYPTCVSFATNSLVLIRSLERNIPHSLIWHCLEENDVTLDKLRKVWKKKALFFIGKAQFRRKNFKEAGEALEEALGLVVNDKDRAAEANELRFLAADAKAELTKEKKREKSTWSKAFKKGKEQTDGAYSPPSSSSSSPVKTTSTSSSSNNDKKKVKKVPSPSTDLVAGDFFSQYRFWLGFGIVTLGAIGAIGAFWRYKKR